MGSTNPCNLLRVETSGVSHDAVLEWLREIEPFAAASDWERTSVGNEIVMLAMSPLRFDPRVERGARALAGAGWHVRIVAPDISTPSLAAEPLSWGPGISFHLLPLAVSQYVTKAPWLVSEAFFLAAVAFRPFAYHCHDLNTALIGLRAAREMGARWVCDFHEWFSENVTFNVATTTWEPHDSAKKAFFRWAEVICLQRADAVITVSERIALEMENLIDTIDRHVEVIRNIPKLDVNPTRTYPPVKTQLGLTETTTVVLYQGGTGPSRLLEPVIKALALSPKITLVIRGPSLDVFGRGYRNIAKRVGVSERLILTDPVPSADVVAAACGADAGLWTLPNLSKNFYLALPNKVFEYLASGLPLLVADFPEPRRIVERFGVGMFFDPYDPSSIAAQMNRLVHDVSFAERCRAAIPGALVALKATREWDRLADLYERLRLGRVPVCT